MTTIYVPHLIETAEQAEALPEGTIITHAENYPQEKFAGLWGREGSSSESLAEEEGWTALVPIEAEEELQRTYATPASTFPGLSWPEQHDAWKRRLVTPWEEA